MVCCSICSTWRHVHCGGHYTTYSPKNCDKGSESFRPVCDLCHSEKSILETHPMAKPRISRQRTAHLRRTQATTATMKHHSYAKHDITCKWPLGSVSAFDIGSHIRNVHVRHEQSEKQWGEMAAKLNSEHGYRRKERVKMREQEFESLLIHLEDAGKSNFIFYFRVQNISISFY